MNFPINIADQQELNRLISEIVKEATKEAVEQTLLLMGVINPDMSPSQCAKLSPRTRVEKALKSGVLKFKYNAGKKIINRSDFNAWKQKHTL